MKNSNLTQTQEYFNSKGCIAALSKDTVSDDAKKWRDQVVFLEKADAENIDRQYEFLQREIYEAAVKLSNYEQKWLLRLLETCYVNGCLNIAEYDIAPDGISMY